MVNKLSSLYHFAKHINLAAVVINSFGLGVSFVKHQHVFVFIHIFIICLSSYILLQMAEKEAILKMEDK
jgi:hypothetical protein